MKFKNFSILSLQAILFILFFLLMSSCSPHPRELPPPLVQAEIKPPLPPKKLGPLIVIDPGHGGEDFGTNAKAVFAYQEKTLNLACAFFLKSYLEELGYQTVMTRKFDCFVSLKGRAEFANKKNPKAFVSVHFNAASSKPAHGVEVYFYPSEKDPIRKEASKKLAKSVLDKVIQMTDAKSRGVKEGNFAVIRETTMPAILVEGGFLTNDQEFEKLKNPAYLRKVAKGIALGVDAWASVSVPGAS